jgi:Fe-Mn family superoxide dismutase
MAFTLPPLPYDYNALEPYIDTQTMQLHHDKHHATYVNNLNDALKEHAFVDLAVEEVLRRINEVPENVPIVVHNNGGDNANHSLFWSIMKPKGGGEPSGDLANATTSAFGSGWGWLVLGNDGKLQVTSGPNQDSPLMNGLLPITEASLL